VPTNKVLPTVRETQDTGLLASEARPGRRLGQRPVAVPPSNRQHTSWRCLAHRASTVPHNTRAGCREQHGAGTAPGSKREDGPVSDH